MSTSVPANSPQKKSPIGGAKLVAAGILLSRLSGLVREKVFAHYFGNSDAGDAFKAALKIPNFLQNLFGEGVLSASFIPVYAGLLAQERKEDAGKVAGAIASLLGLAVSLLVLLGVLATPTLIDVIAPGFHGEKRELTIRLVQIFFPGTGLLVMSAWCLGILNSHRKFFLSYAAPVLCNAATIGAMLLLGGKQAQNSLALTSAWGLVLGCALQFLIQLPVALRLVRSLKFGLGSGSPEVRKVIVNFGPVVVSRGVVQVSAYIDNVLASWLPTGAVSALAYAQTLYLLPISLFGMSVSAAELPQMSSASGTDEEIAAFLRSRINRSLKQIAFFVVPSAMAFFALGDVIISLIFQGGEFTRGNSLYVWQVLAGSTIGLLSAAFGRIYSSAFYALRDTRSPLRAALVRVALTTALGWVFAFVIPRALGINAAWGTAGLTASAGMAGWVEFVLLRRGMNRRIGVTGVSLGLVAKLWGSALVASGAAWAVKLLIGHAPRWVIAFGVLGMFGLVYLGFTTALGIEEARGFIARFSSRLKGRIRK